jgi:hypothetical protein
VVGCSNPARARALEIGNGIHSPVTNQLNSCQHRTTAAGSKVKIAERRAAIFANAAIRPLVTRKSKDLPTSGVAEDCLLITLKK